MAEELILEGEARGEAKWKAEMVINALRTRFKRVPKDIEKAILAMSDSIALESLHAQAIQSDTLDEFAEGLRQLASPSGRAVRSQVCLSVPH